MIGWDLGNIFDSSTQSYTRWIKEGHGVVSINMTQRIVFPCSVHLFFECWFRLLQRLEHERAVLSVEVRKLRFLLHEERANNEKLQKSVNDSHVDKAIFLSLLSHILLL